MTKSPLLKPQHIGYVGFTDHAEEKIESIGRIDRDVVIGKLLNLDGSLWWESDAKKWELYDESRNVAIKFALHTPDGMSVEATVVTVFIVSDAEYRYYISDRMEKWP